MPGGHSWGIRRANESRSTSSADPPARRRSNRATLVVTALVWAVTVTACDRPGQRGRLLAGYGGRGCQQAQSGLDQRHADPVPEPGLVEEVVAGLGGWARRD